MSTLLLAAVVAALGGVVGVGVGRAAQAFPWPDGRRAAARQVDDPALAGVAATQAGAGERGLLASEPVDGRRPPAVPVSVTAVVTGLLFAATALRFGLSWHLPAFLLLAAGGVLLAVIDLQHRLLPNRVVCPAVGVGTLLLVLAAAAGGTWDAALRAVLGGAALFAVYLALALIAPGGMGMGDVKLAALLGLHLGWLGWPVVVLGATLGFVVQALAALALLASRRIGLRAELPFGPAMLAGAAVAIGWGSGPPL